MIKTPKEIAAIEATQHVTEMAFLVIKTVLKESTIKDKDIYYRGSPLTSEYLKERIAKLFARHGLENKEGIIISCGKDSAEPHNVGKGILKADSFIVCDIFPVSTKSEYFADMSRTFVKGKSTPQMQKMYNAVLDAQKLAFTLIKPNVKCADIQNTIITFFNENGYKTSGKGSHFKFAEGYVHSLGHGIGKKVHELPSINSTTNTFLKAGMVITVEPGLYYRDIGGVRIEDMVLITKDGCKNLTHFPKTIIIS